MYPRATSALLSPLRFFVVCAALLLGAVKVGYGQTPMERVYATSQNNADCPLCLTIFVNDPDKAIDQDPSTHSTIGITVLGNVWQQLAFPTNISSGTTIRVKIGTSGNILNLLGNISIQAYQNATSVGSAIKLSTLISLIAGDDQAEIVFTPSGTFNAVRIESAGVALGGGLKIYEAYYLKPTEDIRCDQPADVLFGSTGNIAGGLNAVDNPLSAIDEDASTFAVLRANVGAAGNKTHLTAMYNTASIADDSIRIILRNTDGILSANLLSNNLRIRTLLDNSDNGNLLLDPQVLSLTLLSPGSDIQVLTYPISTPFNRVEVSLGGGLLNALSSLEAYEILRIPSAPEITAPNINNNQVTICDDESITISVSTPQAGDEYRWYSQPIGGTAFHTGNSYTLGAAIYGQTYSYYIAKARIGCSDESSRAKATVNVSPQPGRPQLSITNPSN